MKRFNYLFVILLIYSCNSSKEVISVQNKELSKTNSKPNIYNCQLIEKEFINKIGKSGSFKELYLRCSVQDYFIKFCESTVSKKELEPYINNGISVEIEIKDGMWDDCNESLEQVQSRMGTYIVIKSIK